MLRKFGPLLTTYLVSIFEGIPLLLHLRENLFTIDIFRTTYLPCPNISTTSLWQWGFRQLPPPHCRNGSCRYRPCLVNIVKERPPGWRNVTLRFISICSRVETTILHISPHNGIRGFLKSHLSFHILNVCRNCFIKLKPFDNLLIIN